MSLSPWAVLLELRPRAQWDVQCHLTTQSPTAWATATLPLPRESTQHQHTTRTLLAPEGRRFFSALEMPILFHLARCYGLVPGAVQRHRLPWGDVLSAGG